MNSDQNLVVPSAVVATACRALTFLEGELTHQPAGNLIRQELDAIRFAKKTLSSAFPLTPAQVMAEEMMTTLYMVREYLWSNSPESDTSLFRTVNNLIKKINNQ